ncbi:MAG TPA: hypothetical protein VD965_02555 [Burkholderiales bacterium]|nr:hypothetical protein [Burkholderiales bacterium]
MRHLVMIVALLAATAAGAQQASEDEAGAVSAIFRCLAAGLPDNWGRAHVLMTLPSPGATEGNVRYLVAPDGAPDKLDPFSPCDPAVPARILLELRKTLPTEKQNWTGAQVELVRQGSTFRITYDYPK